MKFLFFFATIALLASCTSETTKTEEPREISQYTIDQFYENTRIAGGFFSPDESRLLVSSNVSGIFNVYEINIAEASMTQLTKSIEESYFVADYVPGTGKFFIPRIRVAMKEITFTS